MREFEHIFMNEKTFNEKGIDNSKFKNIDRITSFHVVKTGVFCYLVRDFNIDTPYKIKEIEIPIGKILIIGYYD